MSVLCVDWCMGSLSVGSWAHYWLVHGLVAGRFRGRYRQPGEVHQLGAEKLLYLNVTPGSSVSASPCLIGVLYSLLASLFCITLLPSSTVKVNSVFINTDGTGTKY